MSKQMDLIGQPDVLDTGGDVAAEAPGEAAGAGWRPAGEVAPEGSAEIPGSAEQPASGAHPAVLEAAHGVDEIPSDLPWDHDSGVASIKYMVTDLGIDPKIAAQIVNDHVARSAERWRNPPQAALDAAQAQHDESLASAERALRSSWGGEYDQRMAGVRDLAQLGWGDDLSEILEAVLPDGTRVGNSPALIQGLDNLAQLMGQGLAPREAARESLEEWEADPENLERLGNQDHPGHALAMKQRSRLYAQTYRDEAPRVETVSSEEKAQAETLLRELRENPKLSKELSVAMLNGDDPDNAGILARFKRASAVAEAPVRGEVGLGGRPLQPTAVGHPAGDTNQRQALAQLAQIEKDPHLYDPDAFEHRALTAERDRLYRVAYPGN